MKFEVYFILGILIVLGVYGIQLIKHLIIETLNTSNGLFYQFQYLMGCLWVIGICFYSIFQPIFSELKERKLKITKSKQISIRKCRKMRKSTN